jgi:argonaute-like protein implicated in RNA metabolism and viral defense
MLVGFDIARSKKERGQGSVNVAAQTRFYSSQGKLLRYSIRDERLEGETIPARLVPDFFPLNECQGKRIVIHRDGLFRGEEKAALKKWGSEINAQFHFVEVIKSGAPRLYSQDEGGVKQAAKGAVFTLNEREAFVISSLPPSPSSTASPLHIRCESDDENFTIKEAVDSVLSMTLLHWGSIRPPRLPVTTHYSDTIAGLALRGIKPCSLDGDVPYWL